jgi:hypothetical protein
MPGEDEADILRKFKAAISGMELADQSPHHQSAATFDIRSATT